MKLFIATLVLGLSATSFAGPSSSGGVNGVVKTRICTGAEPAQRIQLNTYENGSTELSFVQGAVDPILADCTDADAAAKAQNPALILSCSEQRAGEGQIRVDLETSMGPEIAKLYQADILGQFNYMASYLCQDL